MNRIFRGVSYTIEVGKKKHGVRLQISKDCAVTVLVPRGFDRKEVPRILRNKWNCIQKTQCKQAAINVKNEQRDADPLPGHITLAAVNTIWSVSYELALFEEVAVLQRPRNRLVISGDEQEKTASRIALQNWIFEQARYHFPLWLKRVADDRGFSYKRIRVGIQHRQWGSCSTQGTISLNAKLMLLPADVVNYVFIHELCHTKHMHHGPAFWEMVQLHDPTYRDKKDILRSAEQGLPCWTDAPRDNRD